MKNTILTDELKNKHQIFTPEIIVDKMIELAKSKNKEFYNCRILENSCGDGNVLIRIVERIILEQKQNRINNNIIASLLQNNIHAYEIDDLLITQCKKRLDDLCAKYGIFNVRWDIKCKDFLKDKCREKYDLVIGNPPYISYLDLPIDKRKYLKKHFQSCLKGKFDYSYAFIEKSYRLLDNEGLLIYLVPSNWFKNVFASALRSIVFNDLVEIIDYQKNHVFKNVLVSTAIICIKKGCRTNSFRYNCPAKKIEKVLTKSLISDKWIFENRSISNNTFGDNFDVFVTIATLKNSIFVLKKGIVSGNYYCFENYKIELGITRPATSPKDKKYNINDKRIIFPYYFKSGHIQHYTEEQIKNKYPFAYKYLSSHKKELQSRSLDKNTKWFEYGRTQAISKMNQEMCIISSIISENTIAYIIDDNAIPYSGICIVPKGDYEVSDVITIINTTDFREYAQSLGVCINGDSKRLSPNDIKDYTYK